MSLELLNIILDVVLILAALWIIFLVRRLRGVMEGAFGTIAWGAILLGVVHLFETVIVGVFGWEEDLVELIQRLVVLAGFVFLFVGFNRAVKLV